MKKNLILFFLALFAFALCGQELPINGNFQPNPRSKYSIPLLWHSQHTELKNERNKVKFHISEPDAKGIHILTVNTSKDFKKNDKSPWKSYCFFGTNTKVTETIQGDEFTLEFEAAGNGPFHCGFLGYGTGAQAWNVKLTPTFQKFRFVKKTAKVKGDATGKAYYRQFFEFHRGTVIRIRNVKLTKKAASGKAAARAGFRYYPVYKLSKDVAKTIQADLPNWKNIPEGKGFLINKLDKFQKIARQTSFKIAHRNGKIYILIKSKEPYMDMVQADKNFWRDGVVWNDDAVEFCISSKRGFNRKHSYNQVNSKGASKRSHAFKPIPNAVFRGKDFWMVRMEFSLDDLLIDGEKMVFNKDYFFNVGRSNFTNGNTSPYSSISKEFGQPDTFQILELHNKFPTLKEKKEAEEFFNGRYLSYLSARCYEIRKKEVSFWKKEYARYGRLDKENLAKALALSKRAAGAKSDLAKEKIVNDYEKMVELLTTARKNVSLIISDPAAVKTLFLNGKKVPHSSRSALTLQQGVNILAAETVPGKKVSFMLAGHPETRNAWRTAEKASGAWKALSFDDRKWPLAQCDGKGTFTTSKYARQILIWENNHYGKWSLLTRTKEWNFVNNSLNTLKIDLDTLTPYPLKEMSLTFELPSAYKTFPHNEAYKGTRTNLKPVRIRKKAASRKGYSCYQYDYKGNINLVGKAPLAGTYLVFQADNSMKAGSSFTLRYSRSSGNIVELMQEMPCRVLGEMRGKLLKKMYIETWYYHHNVNNKFFKNVDLQRLHIKDRLKAGINMQQNEKYYDEYKNTPAHLVILTCYPLWGSGWGIKKHFFNYVKNNREAQARFFGGEVKWGGKAPKSYPRYMDHRDTTQICPTWATTKGAKEYIHYVMEDMKEMRKKYPHATIFYNNWEGFPRTTPMGYCYCDNCKENFRKYAGLPKNIQLTDAAIRDRYWKKYYEFRVKMDGKTAGLVKKAANNLGMKYFLYHQYAHPDYWEAASGNIDIPYQGCPGVAPADSKMQPIMDNVAAYMWKYGYKFFMGQIFNPGWDHVFRTRDASLNSYSGFFEPKTTKPQLIRAAATYRGGLSIWGINLSGSYYYIGEGTRVVGAYEDIFAEGRRRDSLARSKEIAYPNLLVITRKNKANKEERLVLAFNESEKEKTVTFENLSLPKKYIGEIFDGKKNIKDVRKITLKIPPQDVTLLCIREK